MSDYSNVRIRPATMGDLKSISVFNALLAKETEARALDAHILEAGVQSILQDSQKGWYAVAESTPETNQSKLVGQILVTFEWSDWRNAYFWWLQSLYVDVDFRRKGVFRKLYQYVNEQAKVHAETVCGFRLYVEQDNHSAQQVYARVGFQETAYQMKEMVISDNLETSSI